jgi:5-formyltetrahydrofolate cyclo-ligase
VSDVRASLLARRRALDAATVSGLSRQVIDRFLQGSGIAPAEWRGKCVALYRALPGELDLRELEGRLAQWGAELCFPRVIDPKAHRMEFALGLAGSEGLDPSGMPGGAWPTGAFGIQEPPAHHPVVDPRSIDVIFVPGVGFGMKGERIGMGAGFYDHFLPLATRGLRVALAFDFQLLPAIDLQPWDQRMDWIWTERRQVKLREMTPG